MSYCIWRRDLGVEKQQSPTAQDRIGPRPEVGLHQSVLRLSSEVSPIQDVAVCSLNPGRDRFNHLHVRIFEIGSEFVDYLRCYTQRAS